MKKDIKLISDFNFDLFYNFLKKKNKFEKL